MLLIVSAKKLMIHARRVGILSRSKPSAGSMPEVARDCSTQPGRDDPIAAALQRTKPRRGRRSFRTVSRIPLPHTTSDDRLYNSYISRLSPHTWSHVLSYQARIWRIPSYSACRSYAHIFFETRAVSDDCWLRDSSQCNGKERLAPSATR